MIVAGIDEAGLGPVLGPMLVSATAFSVDDALADQSMWQLLSSAVSRKPAKRPTRIAIADSKKLYNRQKDDGIVHLERGVLTVLSCLGPAVANLSELLQAVSPGALAFLGQYPWYHHQPLALPRCASQTGIALCQNSLSVRMDQLGMKLLTMKSEVVFEGEFNRLIGLTDNKSVVLMDTVSRLLMHLWTISAGQNMKIVVDRQGGRWYYLERLQCLLPGAKFKVLDESETCSAYRINDGQRTVDISFLVEAEDQHLPVALASMLCKYLRELFMELFNQYWRGRLPDLSPTAGYHVDGQRFWQQILPQVRQMGLNESMIYRCR